MPPPPPSITPLTNDPTPTTKPTTTNPRAASSSSSAPSTTNILKNPLAAAHGTGEALRGSFNAKIDEVFHEPEGVAKNQRVASDGLREIASGEFAEGTKEREGVVPGDGGRRK